MTATVRQMLGLANHNEVFKNAWTRYGFPAFKDNGMYAETTPTIQQMFADEKNLEPHFFQKRLMAQMEKKHDTVKKDAVDEGLLGDSIPILFDPEILQIMREEAPFLARLPTQGWNGYQISCNRISEWDAPHGFTDEDGAVDMSALGGKRFTIPKIEEKMKIFYDKVIISDFTRMAGDFYMPVRETSLGSRVAAHAQWKEQSVLYGKPDEALEDGSPGSANAFKGLSEWYDEVDKGGVTLTDEKACIQDIKKEIANLLQEGKGISKGDLEIWTSWSMLDYLSNEVETSERIMVNENAFNYGFETIRISGVPVIASHNVAEHEYNDGASPAPNVYEPGSEGDVFIVNKRSLRYFALAPLSVIPLARIGLAEQSALYEFGTLVERSNGAWGKYLSDYQI